MNLYRSFGKIMEAWVAEGSQYSDSELFGNNDGESHAPSSDMETNLCSDSVDSGVETASCDTSFPATSCSAEIDGLIPETECDGLTPASTSQSSVLSSPVPSSSSSSSPRLCPSKPLESSIVLHPKLEEVLQRTDSKLQKDKREPLTVEEVLKRRPQASSLQKRHTSMLVRGHRSASFGPRKTANPPISIWQISEMWTRPRSVSCDKQRLEELGEEERTGLSPGLIYLEQVCQMLEEIAKQQMHNRVLQMEMDALREHQGMQASDTCQSGSAAPEEALSSYQSLESTENAEHSSSEPQQKTDKPCRHFRQRSASDTTFTALHLRQMNSDCRGQHLSTGNLLEKTEKDHEKEESKTEESSKTNKNWRLKIGSLKREQSSLRGSKGKPMQSSEKNSARRQLSQLFRRKKTMTL